MNSHWSYLAFVLPPKRTSVVRLQNLSIAWQYAFQENFSIFNIHSWASSVRSTYTSTYHHGGIVTTGDISSQTTCRTCARRIAELYLCVCSPWCPPYPLNDGPFRVLERSAKYFSLDLGGRQDTVSIDRLKPAFLDTDFGLNEETVAPSAARPQRKPKSPSPVKPL